ncbi:MAG: sulfur carrier protein ThiS [Desulfuromonadales bacterium]|nr:sulfur carrier protein ThiS [Desulfuromonadales bacterium]
MKITVNGKSRELAAGTTVQALLATLQMDADRVAAEHNGSIVPKNRFADTILAEGDSLELVQFVGGG